MLYQGGLQKLDRLGKDGFFVVVAVEQQIMNFCADRGTGMLQTVCKEVVSGNVQGIGDHDQHFKAGAFCTRFDVTYMSSGNVYDISEILLGHLFVSSISLDTLDSTGALVLTIPKSTLFICWRRK